MVKRLTMHRVVGMAEAIYEMTRGTDLDRSTWMVFERPSMNHIDECQYVPLYGVTPGKAWKTTEGGAELAVSYLAGVMEALGGDPSELLAYQIVKARGGLSMEHVEMGGNAVVSARRLNENRSGLQS